MTTANLPRPEQSLRQLHALRGKERACLLTWGASRWLLLAVAVVLAAACVDWWIDRDQDTPWAYRYAIAGTMALIGLVVAWRWLIQPLKGTATLDALARRVERAVPEYDHALVSSIQLTRQSPEKIAGMSRGLIAEITKDAETITARHDFKQFADTKRLKQGFAILPIPLLLAAGFFLLMSVPTAVALMKRQALMDVEIPRQFALENATQPVWAAGDEVEIRYEVAGPVSDSTTAFVRVTPEGQSTETVPLEKGAQLDDGRTLFTAKIPASTVSFEHTARVGDGRTKRPNVVTFEARPVVTQIDAWVELPDWMGKRPDPSRNSERLLPYETYQPQAEIVSLVGLDARVRIVASKELKTATVIPTERTADGKNRDLKPVEMTLLPMPPDGTAGEESQGQIATATFELKAGMNAYRVEVTDKFGFSAPTSTRRGITLSADEFPTVMLLPERFPGSSDTQFEESDVDGMPIPLGGPIRIAYSARSRLGLSRAEMMYRINEGGWVPLPLKKVQGSEELGAFDPKQGSFRKSDFLAQVPFYAMPSEDPLAFPDDLQGGGRFDFQTRTLKKLAADGKLVDLEPGDRIEFYIEVYDKNPKKDRKPGRSDTRVKTIVSREDFDSWRRQILQTEGRIADLEKKQRGIFTRPLNR